MREVRRRVVDVGGLVWRVWLMRWVGLVWRVRWVRLVLLDLLIKLMLLLLEKPAALVLE